MHIEIHVDILYFNNTKQSSAATCHNAEKPQSIKFVMRSLNKRLTEDVAILLYDCC